MSTKSNNSNIDDGGDRSSGNGRVIENENKRHNYFFSSALRLASQVRSFGAPGFGQGLRHSEQGPRQPKRSSGIKRIAFPQFIENR